MEKRTLGNNGPSVGAVGYGAMVLEGYYGQSDDAQGVATTVEALSFGMMIDTADGYGNGNYVTSQAMALYPYLHKAANLCCCHGRRLSAGFLLPSLEM